VFVVPSFPVHLHYLPVDAWFACSGSGIFGSVVSQSAVGEKNIVHGHLVRTEGYVYSISASIPQCGYSAQRNRATHPAT